MNLRGLEILWTASDPRLGWIVALVCLLALLVTFAAAVRQRWRAQSLGRSLDEKDRSLSVVKETTRRRRREQAASATDESARPEVPWRTARFSAATTCSPLDRARTFEVLGRLSQHHELPDLFREIVRAVGEEFGFDRAVLRVYNPQTRLFEARAFHGCDDELVARVSTTDVSRDVYEAMARRALGLGNSYRVSSEDRLWPDRLRLIPEPPDGDWTPRDFQSSSLHEAGPLDSLVVPLWAEEDQVAGYICATTPDAEELPDEGSVLCLEILAHYAVNALAQARLRTKLQRRDIEYSIVSEQLREWQSTRDNFVANVSHELRTPLTSIRAYAETLQRSSQEMDLATLQEFVDVILHESERLTRAFDDLLDVARHQGGVDRPIHGEFDVVALVSNAVADLQPRFDQSRLSCVVDVPDQPLEIQGEENGIRQVVLNLLENAAKFSPEGGRVDARLSVRGGLVRLEISDEGIGIPDSELDRVFERFYQVDGTATRAFGGQGLGLAICRDIVSRHHGRIWAENRTEGGSRFVVALPLRGLVLRRTPDDAPADLSERQQWEAFLQLSISLVAEMLQVQVASIMLVDEVQDVLRIEAAVGLSQEVVESVLVGRGEGVAGQVWREGISLLVPDLDADPRFRDLGNDITYGHRGFLSVPLCWQERVIGVINVNNHVSDRAFRDDDRLLLEALAERLAAGLDSFERYRSGYRRLASVESGVRAMLDVGRERSSDLREYLVSRGLETGRRVGLDEEMLRALAYALRTYDLGLAQVSDQILRKISPLSAEERRHIENHVQLGAELVADLEPSPRVRQIILHHHENFDGSGYPEGLSGEAIPVGARIVRLVDAFSALLHDRPFRPAMAPHEALALMEEGIGRRFCPRVGAVFLELIRESLRDLSVLRTASRADEFDPELDLVEVQPIER